jgi:hypothetical protein
MEHYNLKTAFYIELEVPWPDQLRVFNELLAWCQASCIGTFYLEPFVTAQKISSFHQPIGIWLSDYKDATTFKLRFGGTQ